MNSALTSLNKQPAWATLIADHQAIASLHLRKLFATIRHGANASRSRGADVFLDYSRVRS